MNIRIVLMTLMVYVLIFAQNSLAENAGLKVTISNIDNEDGMVRLAIYNQEDSFPYKPFKTYHLDKASMVDGKLEYFISDIEEGKYAITLLDDKNENREMDKNWLGIPKEGFGFSNNVKPSLAGAPDFEECTFNLKREYVSINIEMQYF